MIRSTATTFALALLLAALPAAPAAAAKLVRPVDCAGNVLKQPPSPGAELVVDRECAVNAGTYKYGDVHIVRGGVLRFGDATIDLWASNILIEEGGSLVAGSPSAPIGGSGAVVTIHLWGADQTGGNPARQGQGISCISQDEAGLTQVCGIPKNYWNGNIDAMGMPVAPGEARRISTIASDLPYANPVTDDYFYAYDPLPFDGASDPTHPVGYFGYKVLAVSYGGTLQLFGKKGATYATSECGAAPSSSGSSWARLAAPALKTTSALTLDRAMSLNKGDRIVVTTTDYLPGHSEELTVAADVSCGTAVTVSEALAWTHNGTRYPLTAVPENFGLDPNLRKAGADTRAAVGLLTRSIRIVSAGDTVDADFPAEPPAGSKEAGYYFGGHVIARQGFRSFQVQGVEFRQLGQGGKLGHYPVHFHHVRKAPPDTFVRDSSIDESMTRWIVLHGTQEVKLERNVGWKSIGHGYYLEDGTEINNVLTANLGAFARAAVDNAQNPRKVPGILAAPDLHATTGEAPPYRSDYDHPTVFWIMNAWNDFTDNLAAGAGTCGVCYWLLPGVNSGMSRDMKWASYASIQNGVPRAGMAPLKSFVGNGCTSAMTSFQTITLTEACQGVGPGDAEGVDPPDAPLDLKPIRNPLAHASPGAPADQAAGFDDYYPTLGDGGHFPTKCDGADADCGTAPDRCSAGNAANCMVTVLDHYTTSFNWAAFNFAAIWLRPQWYLVTDSVITDAQQAGLTIVTGGGYSDSDVIPGHWALVRKSVFIGNTQDCPSCAIKSNPYASNGGPFNPQALRCAMDANFNRPGNFCLSKDEGVSHQVSNFGMYQRLFSVYDGPAFQESNAYLNITERRIDDCTPFTDKPNKVGRCDPVLKPDAPRQSAWLAGVVSGLPKRTPAAGGGDPYCYMPNAAIGWKQPNGFYYPPAFHSQNLFFDGVDIRHFVVSPLFEEGTFVTDTDAVSGKYCIWDRSLFTGFASNDRQTVLNDDDGTLTGYKETTVINLDPFFTAPVDAIQCRSDGSSRTSPYEYVTTVLYPDCVRDGSCARPPVTQPPDPRWNDGDWNRSCTSESCYGVPLWRQDAMPAADAGQAKSIRMMGQETGQRSTLTVNRGTYYLDTTVSKDWQLGAGCTQTGGTTPCIINEFKKNQTYYLFLIFAKATTEQTYRFYVGDKGDFDPASIGMVQASIGENPITYDDLGPLPAGRAHWLNNDKATANGVVEVVLKLSDLPDLATKITAAEKAKCQPASYCAWNKSWADGNGTVLGRCEGAGPGGLPNGDDAVCGWANADLDCPQGGCFGIEFTLPDGFATRTAGDPRPDPRPAVACVKAGSVWDVSLDAIQVSDGVCPQPADKLPRNFCP